MAVRNRGTKLEKLIYPKVVMDMVSGLGKLDEKYPGFMHTTSEYSISIKMDPRYTIKVKLQELTQWSRGEHVNFGPVEISANTRYGSAREIGRVHNEILYDYSSRDAADEFNAEAREYLASSILPRYSGLLKKASTGDGLTPAEFVPEFLKSLEYNMYDEYMRQEVRVTYYFEYSGLSWKGEELKSVTHIVDDYIDVTRRSIDGLKLEDPEEAMRFYKEYWTTSNSKHRNPFLNLDTRLEYVFRGVHGEWEYTDAKYKSHEISKDSISRGDDYE